jgi:two-component system, cell cycle sensor histidine kinase and response regulator CckA
MPIHRLPFDRQLSTARRHLQVLEKRARKTPDPAATGALQGLAAALDDFRAAAQAVQQQNDELLAACEALEAERQRYMDLYAFAPDAYLVTDVSGVIQEANCAAGPARRKLAKPPWK